MRRHIMMAKLTALLAGLCALAAAPTVAAAATDDDNDYTLKSAQIVFDTSARGFVKDFDISVNIAVEAIDGEQRTTIADKQNASVKRKVDAQDAFDLDTHTKLKKRDINSLATKISLAKNAHGTERWLFHYTLT